MERFVACPNLPKSDISLAVVDGRISADMEYILKSRNIRLIKTKKVNGLYDSISYHPDVMIHHIGENDIVVAPNIDESLVYVLEEEGFNITIGLSKISGKYPLDVSYNVARIGEYAFCNVKYTDEVLIEKLTKKGIRIVNVSQGYAKCSLCIVSYNAAITSDRGMHNIINKYNIDNLLITPGHIGLFDMDYGFIGGASGYISKDEIAFFGDVSLHPDYNKIKSFLLNHGKKEINLSKNILVDLGTLIPLKEYSILMQ